MADQLITHLENDVNNVNSHIFRIRQYAKAIGPKKKRKFMISQYYTVKNIDTFQRNDVDFEYKYTHLLVLDGRVTSVHFNSFEDLMECVESLKKANKTV